MLLPTQAKTGLECILFCRFLDESCFTVGALRLRSGYIAFFFTGTGSMVVVLGSPIAEMGKGELNFLRSEVKFQGRREKKCQERRFQLVTCTCRALYWASF